MEDEKHKSYHSDTQTLGIVKLLKVLEKYFDLPIPKEYNDEIIDVEFCRIKWIEKDDEMVYSEYNLFTSQRRPSNRFVVLIFA